MNATLARITQLTGDRADAGDGPLLDAFLSGDQAAFAVLVRRHASLVFSTCRRVLRHQQDAEDAFQATFLVLARRAGDVWPREAVASWLFGVAHRVALKARAVRSRRTVREQPLEEVTSANQPPPDFDLAEAVHRVVAKLPEVYRAAVVACDLQGLSRKEAAERLGWSEGTLSGRLARARELLARRFRRAGLTLPAGGLGAVFATSQTASAEALQTVIDLTTGTANVSASAPVAALTEGVVRSMATFKLKVLAAAVFVACALGFGAFAAAGAGEGDTQPGSQTQPQATPPVATKAEQPKPPPPPPPRVPAKPLTDRDRLQGTWRVVSLTEGGKKTTTNPKDPWVIEVTGNTLKMPFLEGGSSGSSSGPPGNSGSGSSGGTSGVGWKQREYTFVVEEPKEERRTIRTIDLITAQKPVGRGIFEYTLPSAQCASCHQHPFEGGDFKLAPTDPLGICFPVFKDEKKMQNVGVRLALSIDGKRPKTFSDDGVIVFELKRPDAKEEEKARLEAEYKKLADAIKAAIKDEEKRRLEAELAVLQKQLEEIILRDAQKKAEIELRQAEANLEQAKAQFAVAQAEVQRAQVLLDAATKRLAQAEKALAEAKKPKPAAEPVQVFTVHIRTLTAPEKVVSLALKDNRTVSEALVRAADDVPLMSGSVSVWLVRGKEVLPVDLSAIIKNADAKTNYALKVGDQLFIQMKPAK